MLSPANGQRGYQEQLGEPIMKPVSKDTITTRPGG
jgi:hypothetical protein